LRKRTGGEDRRTTAAVLAQPAGARHANHIGPDGARGVVLQPDAASGTLPADCDSVFERVNHFRDGPIAAAARSMARELAVPDDMTPLAAEALVFEMLADAARLEPGIGMHGSMPRWLTRATDMVHTLFRENLIQTLPSCESSMPPNAGAVRPRGMLRTSARRCPSCGRRSRCRAAGRITRPRTATARSCSNAAIS
jgi:hypothetical protein